MKKQMNVLKLTALAGVVATFAVGCASSGYATVDDDRGVDGIGASAGAEVGTDADMDVETDADLDTDLDTDNDLDLEGDVDVDSDLNTSSIDQTDSTGASSTVTAMSFTAVTEARHQNKWMFDPNVQFRAIETYTFAVPDPTVDISATSDLPQFSVNLPPGSVYVEAAGGAGETEVGRVIRHSPNPR